jgi:DNA-binding transcriptional regulator YiaG
VKKGIYSKENQYFLDLMIQARLKMGVTQAELAKRLEKPQSFVSKYEKGERRLDVIECSLAIPTTSPFLPARVFMANNVCVI